MVRHRRLAAAVVALFLAVFGTGVGLIFSMTEPPPHRPVFGVADPELITQPPAE